MDGLLPRHNIAFRICDDRFEDGNDLFFASIAEYLNCTRGIWTIYSLIHQIEIPVGQEQPHGLNTC